MSEAVAATVAAPVDPALYPGTRFRFPEVIDSTILSCYDSCDTKFFHEHVLCLASKEVSFDLHAGAAFARGVEVARREFWFNERSSDEAQLAGFIAFISQWGDGGPEYGEQKDFVNTAGAYFDYFRQYPLDSDPIKPYIMAGDRPAIEFTFAIPLPIIHPVTGNPILYGGRIDLVGYYNNFLTIVDEKTTKQLGATWERQWTMRGQFMGYAWAMQHHGIMAKAAMIRGIAIQKTQYSHLQAIIQLEDWRVERWYRDMLRKVEEMKQKFLDFVQKGTEWKMSWADACSSYGGCMFQDLCRSKDPSIWYDSYQRRVWNPLSRNPTEPKK